MWAPPFVRRRQNNSKTPARATAARKTKAKTKKTYCRNMPPADRPLVGPLVFAHYMVGPVMSPSFLLPLFLPLSIPQAIRLTTRLAAGGVDVRADYRSVGARRGGGGCGRH